MRALFLAVLGLLLTGCTATELEAKDPTSYVDGVYCPDQNGHAGKEYPWTRLVSGDLCCSWQNMGGGQCPEGTSCMNTMDCSTPLPPNDFSPFGARRLTRRTGL